MQPGYLDYEGVAISIDFLPTGEFELIQQTIQDYQTFLGSKETFHNNVALEKIEKGVLVDLVLYDNKNETITLAPNLLGSVLLGRSTVHPPFSPDRPAGFPDEPPEVFADRSGQFSQAVYFKFILAHEITHALHDGNEAIWQSFRDEFWPSVPLGCIPFATYRPGPAKDSDPSLTRHATVQGLRGDKLQEEVLADAVAAHLYAPALLGNRYTDWIENTLPTVLK